ncbi:MAG TPA: GNAT family N-acetyltransferase [Solirubrobacteraceae bacterium]
MERAATAAEVPAVTACLQSAFFEDPLWGEWAFPDTAVRAERLARLMRAWAEPAIPHGWVRISEHAETVAVWFPPSVQEMSDAQEHAFEQLVQELFGARAAEMQALLESFERNHAGHPPHYYLSMWATHRDHAGKRLGTALLERNLAQIDAERMPAYLESTNPANIPRYEALGFRQRSQFGPQGGPVVTTMWRDARAA